MLTLIFVLVALENISACFRSDYRAYQYGAPVQQFQQVPSVPSGARAAAAGKSHTEHILLNKEELFNGQIREFSSEGYNTEGGGPVYSGSSLSCDFESKNCCWANVPQPDDQLDWHVGSSPISVTYNDKMIQNNGSALIVFAKSAAPSDEAQLASCSIGCSSSDIKVRVKHWQSENVLLQICLRESFPTDEETSPLLSCQELPAVANLTDTEIILPKVSLVDIVIVASNLVDERGDVAIIDDIQVFYETEEKYCRNIGMKENSKTKKFESHRLVFEKNVLKDAELNGSETSLNKNLLNPTHNNQSMMFGNKIMSYNYHNCLKIKCNFDNEDICQYKQNQHNHPQSTLTSQFRLLKGHFMNRITGVKENKGKSYAASFLFPRELASLATSFHALEEPVRIRFRYYESTHGIQLKACCGSIDNCFFTSNKFVSVKDRLWRTGSLRCPKGTEEIFFLCENIRTNQGACAIDDIDLVNIDGDLDIAKPLC